MFLQTFRKSSKSYNSFKIYRENQNHRKLSIGNLEAGKKIGFKNSKFWIYFWRENFLIVTFEFSLRKHGGNLIFQLYIKIASKLLRLAKFQDHHHLALPFLYLRWKGQTSELYIQLEILMER